MRVCVIVAGEGGGGRGTDPPSRAQLRQLRGSANNVGRVHEAERARRGDPLHALYLVLRLPPRQEHLPLLVPSNDDAPRTGILRRHRVPYRRQEAFVSD